MINTNLADETGRIYYNIQRNDGVNICQVYGKNNAKSLIDELNGLYEENQHLRQISDIGKTNAKDIVDVLNIQQSRIKELSKENKELRQFKEQVFDLINQHICEYRKAPLLTIQMPMDCKYQKTCLDNHSINIINKAKENAYKELKKELGE